MKFFDFVILLSVFLFQAACGSSREAPLVHPPEASSLVSSNSLLPQNLDSGDLKEAAVLSFQNKVDTDRTPYRNESFYLQQNDGDFAEVLVIAEIRYGASADYIQQQGTMRCSNVGGNWMCNSFSWTEGPDIIAARQQAQVRAAEDKANRATDLSVLSTEFSYTVHPSDESLRSIAEVEFSTKNNGSSDVRFCAAIEGTAWRVDNDVDLGGIRVQVGDYGGGCDYTLSPGESKTFEISFEAFYGTPTGTIVTLCDFRVIAYPLVDENGSDNFSPEYANQIELVRDTDNPCSR